MIQQKFIIQLIDYLYFCIENYIFFYKVFALFGDTNPLHADVFPDIRTMEAEVVRCVATMFHGDDDVCGTVN